MKFFFKTFGNLCKKDYLCAREQKFGTMELSDIDKMVLAQCTPLEKQCIYQAVRAAMLSDGDTGNSELRLLDEVAEVMGLTAEECEQSRSMSKEKLTGVVRDMSYFKRLSTGKLMTQMVYADDIVTQREQLFIQHIFDQFNIPVAD